MKKIVIVTGGAGFIGSHMVEHLLKKNFKVRIIDNFVGGHESNLKSFKNDKNLSLEVKNIVNFNKKSFFKDISYIFHFAGIGDVVPSIERPKEYLNTNVQGTINILENARRSGIKKFIYAASSSCYGIASTPTKESHQINPMYPYALSKYFGEQACMHWNKVYKFPANSIRIFNAFGTRVRTTGAYGAVFGVFLKQKLANKAFTIVGDGTQKRDFIYVTDVIDAFLKAAETKLSGKIWNVGNDNPQSINRLVNLLGAKYKVYIPKRPGEPDCTWACIEKIKKDLNWKPKITFSKGVKLMLENINHWKKAPLWTPEKIKGATKDWFKYLK
ncbi:MAG: NAD-dependent dehydratase [Rickettsiales bacterium]|nr:NAD-dependent dehydratase [Rickettsiales bacterium]|tara:strand:- start:359 stop:1345 length:987 start_codon:yes stop_codon:yes gene_type:complete